MSATHHRPTTTAAPQTTTTAASRFDDSDHRGLLASSSGVLASEEVGDVEIIKDSSQQASFFGATVNLFKAFVGAGILALPNAFMKGGVVTSSILLLVISVTAYHCIVTLLKCVAAMRDRAGHNVPTQSPRDDYHATVRTDEDSSSDGETETDDMFKDSRRRISLGAVGYAAYGVTGRRVSNFSLCATQLGACVAYTSFFAENFHVVFPAVSRVSWVVIASIILCFATQVRHIKYVAPVSLVGVIVFFVSLFVFWIAGFSDYCCVPSDEVSLVDWGGLGFVFGSLAFAMEGVALVLPIQSSMRDKSKFPRVVQVSIVLVTVCYLVFAVSGYMFFGPDTDSVITINTHGSVGVALQLSLSIVLLSTYVVQIFPVILLIESTLHGSPWMPHDFITDTITGTYRKQLKSHVRTSVRLALVLLTGLVAGGMHNFGTIVSITGSLTTSMLAFILPQAFYLKLCAPPLGVTGMFSRSMIRFAALPVTIIVFGLIASVIGLYFSVAG